MTFPTWSEFTEKLGKFEKSINEKINSTVGPVKDDHPQLDKAIRVAMKLLPPPFDGIAEIIYNDSSGSNEQKIQSVLDTMNSISLKGEENFHIVSTKVNDIQLNLEKLKDSTAKEQTLLKIKDILLNEDKKILEKVDSLFVSKLLDAGFKIITSSTPYKQGSSDCWKLGIFMDEDIRSDYDARRSETDNIINQIEARGHKLGTIVFGDGYYGKTVILKRVMFEMIQKGYCIIFAENIKDAKEKIEEPLNKLSRCYDKILVVVDDVHKENNNPIFSIALSNINQNISYFFGCREKELNKVLDINRRILQELNSIDLQFSENDAIAFMEKITSTFPNIRITHSHALAKSLYGYSKGDPVLYNCILRAIVTKANVETDSITFSMEEARNCVSMDIVDEITKLNKLKENNENLWTPFLTISILGMFGIELDPIKNRKILNCANIFPHQLDSLAKYGFIKKSKEGNFVAIHEIRSQEFLTHIFHERHLDDLVSFNQEYDILKTIHCVFKFLSRRDIITITRKCIILNQNKRTLSISKLISENIIEHFEKGTKNEDFTDHDLAEIFCFGIGDYLSASKELSKALKYYVKSLELEPRNVSYISQMGLALDNNGKHKEALETYAKGLDIDPKHSTLWYNKGVSLFNMSKYKESIVAFNESLTLNSTDIDAINNKGRSLLLLSNISEALEQFDFALKLEPNYYHALSNKGWVLSTQKKVDEGLKYIEKSIKIKPNNSKTWFTKGTILYENERYKEASIALDEATRIEPTNSEYWHSKGLCLHVLGKYKEAITSYNEAIRLNPNYFQAISDKGNSYISLGDSEQALVSFDEAITINSSDPIIWYNKAVTYFNLGRYEDAIRFATEATRLAENYVSAWALQIACFSRMGNSNGIKYATDKLNQISKSNSFEESNVDRHSNIGSIFSR